MGVRDGLVRLAGGGAEERAALSFGQWLQEVSGVLRYNGASYVTGNTTYGRDESPLLGGERFALESNGTVYGIFRTRADLFAQGKFVFRRLGRGPRATMADTFTTGALSPLDNPAGLLEACEMDVACTGASYHVLLDGEFQNLPAEHCTIVCGSNRNPEDPRLAWDAKRIGLIYHPTGSSMDPEVFLWSEVAPYTPERDPRARYRGMSWLRPAMEDVEADNAARRYLTNYYRNNATPNMAVTFPADTEKHVVEAYRDLFLQKHQGVDKAFRTAFLGGGADLRVVGANLKDLDSQDIRQQVHKDIAAAAGVPIVSAGIEQGTYANSKEANRSLADRKVRYLWMRVAEAFAPLVDVPPGAELFIDTSGISALQADALDDAEVMNKQSQMMRTLGDGGWDKTSVRDAVIAGDFSKLIDTGLTPVQLIPPGQAPPVAGSDKGAGT